MCPSSDYLEASRGADMSNPSSDARPTSAAGASAPADTRSTPPPEARDAVARLADDTEGARLLAELGVAGNQADAEQVDTRQDEQADPEHITARAFMDYFLQLQG